MDCCLDAVVEGARYPRQVHHFEERARLGQAERREVVASPKLVL